MSDDKDSSSSSSSSSLQLYSSLDSVRNNRTTRSSTSSNTEHDNVLTGSKLVVAVNDDNNNNNNNTNRNRKGRTMLVGQRPQRVLRRVITGNQNTRVRDHARQNLRRTSYVMKTQVRRVVTGSSDVRVRDWACRVRVVKTVDKFSFVLGVTVLLVTEFVALRHPSYFGLYYVVLVSTMMALRLYMYAKNKWLYFLIDFCYVCNALCFVGVLVVPNNQNLWRLNYALSNGTLLGATLAWRNSFVFHSLDKVTSIAIHLLPALLTFLERWKQVENNDGNGNETTTMTSHMCLDYDNNNNNDDHDCRIGLRGGLVEPLVVYMCWQLLYILKTEVMDRHVMRANPNIQTSLRWLSRDSKNTMHVLAKRICRTLGIMTVTEDFDANSLKTKCIFWVANLLFVCLTLLPIPVLFYNRHVNTTYIVFVLAAAIYNGSNYYFEVFAARYLQKLEEQQQQQQQQQLQQRIIPTERRQVNGLSEDGGDSEEATTATTTTVVGNVMSMDDEDDSGTYDDDNDLDTGSRSDCAVDSTAMAIKED